MELMVRFQDHLEVSLAVQLVLGKDVVGLLQTDQLNHLREQTIADVHDDIQEVSVAEHGAYLVQYCVDHLEFCGK